MNPRAPQKAVHFGEVALSEVFDLRGFNLNAKLDIDPDFLKEDRRSRPHHDHDHDHAMASTATILRTGTAPGITMCHDDDVKSFVFRSRPAFDPAKLEDFLGAIVNIYGPRMLRYKGVLNMKGTDRKVIFQGVHQLMGSDLGPKWQADTIGEDQVSGPNKPSSKMVFIGIDLPKDILKKGVAPKRYRRPLNRPVASLRLSRNRSKLLLRRPASRRHPRPSRLPLPKSEPHLQRRPRRCPRWLQRRRPCPPRRGALRGCRRSPCRPWPSPWRPRLQKPVTPIPCPLPY
jgi:hypothetical protein